MLASTKGPLVDDHDVVMLDLDGVVYVGPDAVPGAAEALSAVHDAGTRLAYLTNNASRPAATVVQHLRDLGMPVDDDGVVTSAQAITRVVAEAVPSGAKVLLVGGAGLREPLEAAGLRCVDGLDDEPIAVVQGYHPDVGWRELAEASYAIASGLPWFVSNTDLTIPTARGIAPGNGSLVQAVRNATGAEPVVAGKPERPLFDETLRRIDADKPLMVGDRLDTDIDGAVGAGIPSLFVLTGVDDLAAVFAAGPGHRPDFVAADLDGLSAVHEGVDVDGDQAHCGGVTARIDAGAVEVDGPGRSLGALRAAVTLAWTSGSAPRPGGTLDA